MPNSATKALKFVALALCWVGLVPDYSGHSRYLLTIASEFEKIGPSQTDTTSPAETENLQYEGLFTLPADGADPFDGVSILRANAVALKKAHVSDEVLQSMTQLVQQLIHEEAHNIQHQTDMWLISQTKNAVDTLHTNPAAFPATGYLVQEGSNGALHVKRPPEDLTGDFPTEFGYDTANRRTVKLAFGDSVVTVVCDKTLHSGAGVGVSHGSYSVTINGRNNSAEGTTPAEPVEAGSPTSPDDNQTAITVGTGPLFQAKIGAATGPGSIVASYQNTRIKFDTHPEGRRHGAEFGNGNFVLGVTRDFDDRINIVKRKFNGHWCEYTVEIKETRFASDEVGPYSIQLETDLADDKNHAYSGTLTAKTPQTGKMVFGGGFDETNYPTTALTLEARDMSINFNGRRGDPGYNVRIGPFVFDVVLSNELPEFILREVKS
ncbi:hypothetical protein, conserved [Eimeria praecox]|uniref:Uncharacterized protein n=1 Tax=Eimeria praecox TaxID=51316 RepID=U6H4N8_9EIME|nr:hypothetical protein, conserved [Eimeria praecox]